MSHGHSIEFKWGWTKRNVLSLVTRQSLLSSLPRPRMNVSAYFGGFFLALLGQKGHHT